MTERLLTPVLAGIPIHLESSRREDGDHIAVYSPPLSRRNDAGTQLRKLGKKPTRITLNGYLSDNTAKHGSAYDDYTALHSLISLKYVVANDHTGFTGYSGRRQAAVQFVDEHGGAFAVMIETIAANQARRAIGIIDVAVTMIVHQDSKPLARDSRTAAETDAVKFLFAGTPPPEREVILPPAIAARQREADTLAENNFAGAWKPPQSPAEFNRMLIAARGGLSTAAASGQDSPSLFQRLLKIKRQVVRLRQLAEEIKANPLAFASEFASGFADQFISGSDLPFSFAELISLRTLFELSDIFPALRRNKYAALYTGHKPDFNPPVHPVDRHFWELDEYRKRLVRRAALGGKVIADGQGEFSSRQDAEAEREITNGMLTAEAADNLIEVAALRAASESAFAASIPRLASIQEYDSDTPLPSVVASFRFTGNLDAAERIAGSNVIRLVSYPPFYA